MVNNVENLIIREASSADFEALKGLYLGLRKHHLPFDETYQGVEEYKHEVGIRIEEDMNLPYSTTLLACDKDGKALGFGIFQIREKSSKADNYGYVKKAFILPEARGKGIFKKLFAEGEKWIRLQGVDYIELQCDSKNDLGLRNWDSLGFDEVKKIMRKKINE